MERVEDSSRPLTAASRPGSVLSASEGEQLVHFRDGGLLCLKAGPDSGCAQLAVATQQVMTGSGISIHRHRNMDEIFYVVEGQGTCTLAGARHSFKQGATIFIPRNTWHSFENPDRELYLLWIVTPGDLAGFFRATCAPPGEPPKQLTAEQIRAIALEYGTEYL